MADQGAERHVSRRDILKGIGIGAVATVAAATGIDNLIPESKEKTALKEWPLGKHLKEKVIPLGGGSAEIVYEVTDKPHPVRVEGFQGLEGSVGPLNDGKVIFRNRPTGAPSYYEEGSWGPRDGTSYKDEGAWNASESLHRADYDPGEVKAGYVTPVFGDYVDLWGHTGEGGISEIHNDGNKVRAGLWYALTDEAGKLVKPSGEHIPEGQNGYYVHPNFVTTPQISGSRAPSPADSVIA